MPDASGRFKGISVPRLPWLAPDGVVQQPTADKVHVACGTAACCGQCPTASAKV